LIDLGTSSIPPARSTYRVCHRIRLSKRDDYFWVNIDHFLIEQCFEGSWSSIENWLEPKTEPPSGNLVCPNL